MDGIMNKLHKLLSLSPRGLVGLGSLGKEKERPCVTPLNLFIRAKPLGERARLEDFICSTIQLTSDDFTHDKILI